MATEGQKAVVLDYTPAGDDRIADVRHAKQIAADYFDAIVALEAKYGRHRDFSLAKTKLQEASMWLTRGLTNPE